VTGFETGEVFTPKADDPRVTIRVTPAAAWVAEAYPAESVTERADGSLDVVLAVSEPAWLERLLLRLGPDAVVIAPKTLRNVGTEAAQRVLGRYSDNAHSVGRNDSRPDTRRRRRT
jgi:proteasome accessory factor C